MVIPVKKETMLPFRQHEFQTTVEPNNVPRIIISDLAMEKMYHCVNGCEDEISWLGTIEETQQEYIIDDVYIMKQVVSGASTELDKKGLAVFARSILKLPNGVDIWNRMRFWGHSHVDFDVEPSGQDDDQMEEFAENGHPYMIRGIFNREGQAKFDIFNYQHHYKVLDAAWATPFRFNDSVKQFIESEIKKHVKQDTNTFARSRYHIVDPDDLDIPEIEPSKKARTVNRIIKGAHAKSRKAPRGIRSK